MVPVGGGGVLVLVSCGVGVGVGGVQIAAGNPQRGLQKLHVGWDKRTHREEVDPELLFEALVAPMKHDARGRVVQGALRPPQRVLQLTTGGTGICPAAAAAVHHERLRGVLVSQPEDAEPLLDIRRQCVLDDRGVGDVLIPIPIQTTRRGTPSGGRRRDAQSRPDPPPVSAAGGRYKHLLHHLGDPGRVLAPHHHQDRTRDMGEAPHRFHQRARVERDTANRLNQHVRVGVVPAFEDRLLVNLQERERDPEQRCG